MLPLTSWGRATGACLHSQPKRPVDVPEVLELASQATGIRAQLVTFYFKQFNLKKIS